MGRKPLGAGSGREPVLEEVAALAIFDGDDPDVGVEIDLAREVGVLASGSGTCSPV